ncbi:MAG: hypothetical protein KF718_18090 [Polyangiaceae bacterium]|nr:hypothetical protein [Polyangiaceae bacterium]
MEPARGGQRQRHGRRGGQAAAPRGSGGSAMGGAAGSGGTGGGTPNCNTQPSGTVTKTIKQLWTDDPTTATAVWVPNVVVTAISGGGCVFGTRCQLMVQQDVTYASFAAGAQNALRVDVADTYAGLFAAAVVGSRVDVYGWAWRHTNDGLNELLIEVSAAHPGCAKVVGSASPTPITVQLTDLTQQAYETTHGPLLVRVEAVSGKPGQPNETFALWKQGQFSDAGVEAVVSVSPFYLSGYQFSGLTTDLIHNFTSVTGVFGLFVPTSSSPKYKQLLIRTMADAPFGGQ